MDSSSVLNRLGIQPFKPLRMIPSGLNQTMAAFIYPYNPFLWRTRHHTLTLPDGDQLILTENPPLLTHSSQRIAVLVHGLTGSDHSKYMIRIARSLIKRGYTVFRMNLRGCGPGKRLAKNPYHSGRSDDLRMVIEWLAQKHPHAPITAIGFSLGANIVLKCAGEDSTQLSGRLDSVIAVSPPLDLRQSALKLQTPANKDIDSFFVKALIKDATQRKALFPEQYLPNFQGIHTIYDFDNVYTAPISGFKDADDYYQQSSSGPLLANIRCPTLILHAKDDPVVCDRAFDALPENPNLDVILTENGGHVAWLGPSGRFREFGNQWMDRLVVEWLKELLSLYPALPSLNSFLQTNQPLVLM